MRSAPTAAQFEPYILSLVDATPRRAAPAGIRAEIKILLPVDNRYTHCCSWSAAHVLALRIGSVRRRADYEKLVGAKQAPCGPSRDTLHGGEATSANQLRDSRHWCSCQGHTLTAHAIRCSDVRDQPQLHRRPWTNVEVACSSCLL